LNGFSCSPKKFLYIANHHFELCLAQFIPTEPASI